LETTLQADYIALKFDKVRRLWWRWW